MLQEFIESAGVGSSYTQQVVPILQRAAFNTQQKKKRAQRDANV